MTVADASRLWQSDDPHAWEAALESYPSVVARQEVNDLVELDRWYREALPIALAGREPPSLELPELVDVVRWKMKRGEWRPRNMTLVKSNDVNEVRWVTEQAFAAVPDQRQPIKQLCDLAGVGPATASALLAAYRPDLYPFLDDIVAVAIPALGEPKFTLGYYVRYADTLRSRAIELGPTWTAQSVGLALWAASGGKAAGGTD